MHAIDPNAPITTEPRRCCTASDQGAEGRLSLLIPSQELFESVRLPLASRLKVQMVS